MRIIAGEFRSRRIKSVPGLATRPTPDRLREALFNVLAPNIEGSIFLDAYAGCGAVGIEALSRGAEQAIFIENHRTAVRIIQQNLRSLDLETRSIVIRGPVTANLRRFHPDIVFLDPPYELVREYEESLNLLGSMAPSLVVAQHATCQLWRDSYGLLRRTRILRQGDNSLSFFEPSPESPPESPAGAVLR
jgi:16S rRNA (guanine(966)-N(2))-methyltransferase RsmD